MAGTKSENTDAGVPNEALPADVVGPEEPLFGEWLAAAAEPDWNLTFDDGGFDFDGGGEVVLAVSDMVTDSNNEVVLMADPSLDVVRLVADSGIADSGLTESHVTVSGQDVSGYHYVSFESGLTLFYGDGVNVVVDSGAI